MGLTDGLDQAGAKIGDTLKSITGGGTSGDGDKTSTDSNPLNQLKGLLKK